jgi:signal peptidase II
MELWERRKKYIAATVLVFMGNFLLDRVTKVVAKQLLLGVGKISFLRDLMILVYSENQGAFLSMGQSWPGVIKYSVLLVLPILACVAGLYYFMFREREMPRLIYLTTMIGGGMGNLIDRLFNNFQVIDFLNFGIGPFRTGILNVADLSVTVGTVLFIIEEMRKSRNNRATTGR